MLKNTYGSVESSAEFKEQMRERLSYEAQSAGMSEPLLARPRLMIPILVAVMAALIGYGSWLSMNIVPSLLP
jgi:hypothetical protein